MAVVPVAAHVNHESLPSSQPVFSNNKTFFSKIFSCGCFSSHQQQQRTAASRPVTPVLTDQEQRSEEKTSSRDLFCPICMYYAGQVLSMQCCGHSVCFVCTSDLVDSTVAAPMLACMHCAKPSFHAASIAKGGRVYEDSPSVMKMQLRQRNRLAMSGSGSITLPSPLKRGDGFDALAAKLVSYEQHANMLMTLPDTPTLGSVAHETSDATSGRSSPDAVPTLQPAPCARATAAAKGLEDAQGRRLGGRSRPTSPSLSLSSSSGVGAAGRSPSALAPALRPATPVPDTAVSPAALSPADASAAAWDDAAAAAAAAAFVAAAGGVDDVRASLSMVDPILAEEQPQESAEEGPSLNVPLQ